jgi:predicted dehydrogenase
MEEAKRSGRRRFLKQSVGSLAVAAAGSRSRGILGANDRLRIGIIGCGGRGNYLLREIEKLAEARNLEIAALCDVWQANLARTQERVAAWQSTPLKTASRYREVITDPDLDAVVIATPDFAHTPILIDALMEGKDVYVEKPMATRLEDANRAVDLARSRGSVVQVGTQRRSDPRYWSGARLIQSGILGRISEIEAGWHDCRPRWARDYSDVRPQDVDWEQFLMDLPPQPFNAERFRRWQLFQDFTVGTPGLLGSHLIDVATWFMNDPLPTSAVAHGGVYVWKDGREHADTLDCIIEYPKGFLVNYSTRLGNRYPNTTGEDDPIPTTFYGTRGTFDTVSWEARGEGAGEDALKDPVLVPPEESEGNHVENWIECVRTRDRTSAPIEAGHAHSVASIMCFKAWRSGRRQVFDPISREIKAE